jgi:hypothetical protein
LIGKVISIRDVIFNEDEFFPGNLDALRDDFLRISKADLMTLLEEVEEPELTAEPRVENSGEPNLPIFDDDDAYAADRYDVVGGENEQDHRAKDGADKGPEAQYPTPQESPMAGLFALSITQDGREAFPPRDNNNTIRSDGTDGF